MDQSTAASFFLLTTAVLAPIVSRGRGAEFLHPAALVTAAWAGTLGLFFLRVIPYAALEASTVAVVAVSIGSMVAVIVAMQASSRAAGRPGPQPAAPNTALLVMSTLGILGTIWYVRDVTDVLGGNAFFVRPSPIRIALAEGRVPSRYLILQFLCVATPLLAGALALTGHRIARSTWLLVILCTLGTWISTDRTQFFLVALTVYFMWVMRRGVHLKPAAFAGASLALVAALASYFLAVGYWQGKTPEVLNLTVQLPAPGGVEESPAPTAASQPSRPAAAAGSVPAPAGWLHRALQRSSTIYLYATGSYAALEVLLSTPEPRTYGVHSVYPIARLLDRLGVIGPTPSNIPPFVPLGLTRGQDVAFNSYTFLYYPIVDFGPAGAVFYSVAVGLLAAFVYGRYSGNRDSAFWLLSLGQLSTALVLTVFVNKFNNTASWYIYVWSCAPFLVSATGQRLAVAQGAARRSAAAGRSIGVTPRPGNTRD